jgi:hypothetical protein
MTELEKKEEEEEEAKEMPERPPALDRSSSQGCQMKEYKTFLIFKRIISSSRQF